MPSPGHLLLLLLLLQISVVTIFPLQPTVSVADGSFVFDGFRGANMSVDGGAGVTHSGVLALTDAATKGQTGHAFLSAPLRFRSSSPGGGGEVTSFSTTFVFAIVPVAAEVASFGMALVFSPTGKLPRNKLATGVYMGLFDRTNDGNATNHILAVEFDVTPNGLFGDIDDNHVGIDVNSITSLNASSAAYYGDGSSRKENLTLAGGKPMQAWAEYDGGAMRLAVTIAPLGSPQPETPLLQSSPLNLSGVFLESMYVGFSAATGKALTSHYVLGWSFRVGPGKAPALDLSSLPAVPRTGNRRKTDPMAIWLPIVLSVVVLAVAVLLAAVVVWKIKFAEIREDWELEYGPHRFSYRDLYRATRGFRRSGLLGVGGFGEVYRGVLPSSKTEVAVKKIAHGSTQGMREFVSEIVTIGLLRHRNLVQLLGYSRRRGGLFLVYDYMPNGSLDKLLFERTEPALSWARRFHIVKGVAAGLLYLHEEWEQVVIHRDVKASNVLLDADFNGRLGDFGLSRLYDHGSGPQTTHVVGTMGYMAPELARTGKATKATDVYAYGAFLLEVACGRRPIGGGDRRLVDCVLECWRQGEVSEAADPRLGRDFEEREMVLVLMLGLHCCNPSPAARPGMRQVVQLLDGEMALPELSPPMDGGGHQGGPGSVKVFDETTSSYASSRATEMLLSGGR
ncbi:hypothetical protein Taro_056955 [Colocasia esculenta]|uniref:non-specific serine/threonine protein kinase n=1 Tax=Colocasia esculenta TaxID=4460 RepID=A0A843XYZ2_COLES|nr:hypothetical protein [Colocasia esculenta]